jgi:hypothetical protein
MFDILDEIIEFLKGNWLFFIAFLGATLGYARRHSYKNKEKKMLPKLGSIFLSVITSMGVAWVFYWVFTEKTDWSEGGIIAAVGVISYFGTDILVWFEEWAIVEIKDLIAKLIRKKFGV